MSDGPIFNPLTFARREASKTCEALILHSFAQGRSLLETVVAQSATPRLFAWLAAWLDGAAPGDPPALTREQHLELWSNGLLVSAAERAAMPSGARAGYCAADTARALCPAAGILLEMPLRLREPDEAAAADLRRDGLAVLPCLFDAPDLAAIRAWYRLLADSGWLKPDRHQTSQRIIHNDPVARHVQFALTPLLTRLADRPVKPSFSYATEYHSGGNLPRHTDRAQCEWTFSIFLDFEPDPGGEVCPWPLIVHATAGDREFRQERGGALLFRGRQLEHSRPCLRPGDKALLFFLCYVAEEFEGSLD